MYEYQSLPSLTKQYDAKDWPSPTKIFSSINKAQTAFFKQQMKNKNSAIFKATQRGTQAHNALEKNNAKSVFEEKVLDIYEKNIAVDIDETWAKEMGLVSVSNRFKGKFDGVGVFRGKTTVWDFKKTNKLKTNSQMTTYFKQCAAYCIAHDEMYDSNIEQVAIFNIGGKEIDDLSVNITVVDPITYKRLFKDDIKEYERTNI